MPPFLFVAFAFIPKKFGPPGYQTTRPKKKGSVCNDEYTHHDPGPQANR